MRFTSFLLCIFKYLNIENILWVSICYGVCLVVDLFFTSIYFTKHKEYTPHFKLVNLKLVKKIATGGFKIIYIQFLFFYLLD